VSSSQTRARLLDSFVGEHRGHVETIRKLASVLEQGTCSPEHVATAQRALHSLKGTSRLLDFSLLSRLSHAGEVLLLELAEDTPQSAPEQAQWLNELAAALEDGLAVAIDSVQPDAAQSFLARLEQRTGQISLEVAEDAPPPPGEERRRTRTAQISVTDLNRLVRDIDYLEQQSSQLQGAIQRLRSLEMDLSGELRRDCRHLRHELQTVGNRLREASRIVRQDSRKLVTVPAHDLLSDMGPRARQLAQSLGKRIEFVSQGWDHEVELPLLQSLVDPLWHLLRNSLYHGIEAAEERTGKGKPEVGRVWLGVERSALYLRLWVADDGRGLQLEHLRRVAQDRGLELPKDDSALLFLHGLSTVAEANEMAGRGLGMGAVRERVVELGGQLIYDPEWRGCRFDLVFPQRSWDVSVVMVRVGAYVFGLPTQHIKRLVYWESSLLERNGEQRLLFQNGQARSVIHLAARLGMPMTELGGKTLPLVEVGEGEHTSGYLLVDAFVGQRQVVVEPMALPDWPEGMLEGCCLLDDGEVGLILNPQFFSSDFAVDLATLTSTPPVVEPRVQTPRLLVVDDSATVRGLHATMLQEAGYEVIEAENGQAAWDLLLSQTFDLVISDIQMPLMDGFGLLKRIRNRQEWQDLPVVLLTSLAAPEEQQRGLDLGADAYLLKQTFDQRQLLDTVGSLL
jgi:two-component system, chemotaxis family, sensor kinase CheA